MKHLFHLRVLVITIFALLITITPPVLSLQADTRLDTCDRAIGLAEQADYDGARTNLSTFADNTTNDSFALATRGSVELAAGKADDAEPLFQAALTAEPLQLSALWGLTLCQLQRGRVHEAELTIGRAATVAPNDNRIKTLQAYIALQLDHLNDAALLGKTALENGERSSFLMATLAQIHHRLGYEQKAVEFGSFATKYLYGKDLRATDTGVYLPMTIAVTDTDIPAGQANVAIVGETPKIGVTAQPQPLPDPKITIPAITDSQTARPRFEITSPATGSTLHGTQRIQAVYRGQRQITFVTFLVDGTLRGMITELPYQFQWDADAVSAGEHILTARAYDTRGAVLDEAEVKVMTTSGKPSENREAAKAVSALQERMMKMTMPLPAPLSLYTNLGQWHMGLKEVPQAIDALEKSVALDPTNETILQTLQRLYKENGLHPISPTGEVVRGPATGKKRVAITFDDGPNPLYTPTIIAELARYDGHSTFFVVGKMVRQYPDQALLLLANGHELANHTYNHPNLTKLPAQDVVREALLNRAVIKEITGRDTYLFRPPGGNIDAMVTKEMRDLDYNIIYWNINAGEFRNYTPAEQSALISARVQDGSILLMHNGPVDGTMNILPMLLADLHRKGFTFVTVSELMKGK